MSDNPFAEPGDDDRTVIRPMPGGRRTVPPAAPPPLPIDPPAAPAIGVSPLTIAASPLLQVLERLRAARRPPDLQVLRQRVVQDLDGLERSGRAAGIPMEQLRPAHYALCASIDDVVLNAPWGSAGGWAARTLVATFHPGARGTDAFFDQLGHMLKAADRFLPVLELMYLCLSLGFIGRYREARGQGEPERLRAEVYAAVAARRPTAPAELSSHWHGVAAPYRTGRRGLPIWVAFAAAAAICGALLIWTATSLNAASDGVAARALATPPAHMPRVTRAAVPQPLPAAPPSHEPTLLDRLRASLQADIDRGALSLLGSPATPVIRIPDRGMFAPASAAVQPTSLPLLERIATALRNEGGSVRVIGYTDNQPIRTVQFPSNFQLSAARADTVRGILARTIGEPARLTAEGRGDADPIAPNTTADGREQNRRIELVLQP
jgi:type VI secretion system protein ImpK